MTRLTDALDDVLARVSAGEPLDGCVERYPNLAAELTQLVGARDRLRVLAHVPEVPDETLVASRRRFLATARAYQQQSGSAQPLQRFLAWVWPRQRAGQPALWPALARAAIAVVLTLGVVSGTVAAAQSSLPGSPLYPFKLTVEDTRLELAQDPAQQTTLAMTFAGVRISEMERLAIADRPISPQLTSRLQTQLDAALSAARQEPESEMTRLLEHVRTMAQEQQRTLAQAQISAPQGAGSHAALSLAEQVVTQTQQRAEAGLADPEGFRNEYRHGPEAIVESTPLPEAPAVAQSPTPTAVVEPTATRETPGGPSPAHTPKAGALPRVGATPPAKPTGTVQSPASGPEPQATATPQQAAPETESTPDPAGPGLQPTATPTETPGPARRPRWDR